MAKQQDDFYFLLISIHGLIRGHDLELGRDADTGGQIKYVLELTRALAEHPSTGRVELLTRQVIDPKVHGDYGEQYEVLDKNARIVRLPCGPRRYLRKEVLWPHLDGYVDNVLQHIRNVGRLPDFIHGHYADGGYVAARLSQLLGVPMAFTGHSLGRVKRFRLLEKGLSEEKIDDQYNFPQRIEAEEVALGNANVIVTSTHQEVEEQYPLYDNYHPRRMTVIPPGVDLKRFHHARAQRRDTALRNELSRFLNHPRRPMVLAIARPDERKNLATLVTAFAENPELRETANLVIVAGNRDDIETMDKGSRDVLRQLLLLIDKYDLYGSVAYPKHHDSEQVEQMYRLAAKTKGVFVNPALTEPFGLTLIEAAACGLPIIATEDGGPRDIIGLCKNGELIDPLNAEALGYTILSAIKNTSRWERWSKQGINGSHKHFSWESHAENYMRLAKRVITSPRREYHMVTRQTKTRLPIIDRVLVCDIDNTLLGDENALRTLMDKLHESPRKIGLAVATGRRLESAMEVLEKSAVPVPDFLITAVGAEIYYGHGLVEDTVWKQHINYRWHPRELRKAMKEFPGLKLQAASEQREHKISYNVDPARAPSVREISAHLRKLDLHTKLIYSHEAFLDLLPVRASKGLAIRYLSLKWGLPPERILVAGDSGNDEEMLRGNTLGLVVGNFSPELARLQGRSDVYFANGHYAWGIIEGIDHYHFLGDLKLHR